jgi:uncharacterized protein (TIGR02466 family)
MLLDQTVGGDIILTFATPVLVRPQAGSAALNARLTKLLTDRERAEPQHRTGKQRFSNIGGWRPDDDPWKWPEPEMAEFRQIVIQGMGSMLGLANGLKNARLKFDGSFAAWININRDGSYNVPHSHPDNSWSAVYYVATGQPDPKVTLNGAIQFQDPRGAALFGPLKGFDFGHPFTVQPEAGMLLVFPSWLIHYVHPFKGKGARISIPVNLKLNSFGFVQE